MIFTQSQWVQFIFKQHVVPFSVASFTRHKNNWNNKSANAKQFGKEKYKIEEKKVDRENKLWKMIKKKARNIYNIKKTRKEKEENIN